MEQKGDPDKPHHPHDTFFHECLSVIALAKAVLRQLCPQQLAAHLDWETLEVAKAEYKFARPDHQSAHICDMLYAVQIRGADNCLNLHLEHLSDNRERPHGWMGSYRDAIRAGLRREAEPHGLAFPPLIVHFVIYQGPLPLAQHDYGLSDELRAVLNPYIAELTGQPVVLDLAAVDYAALYAAEPAALFFLVAKAVRAVAVMDHLPTILAHLQMVYPFSESATLRQAVLFYLPRGIDGVDRQRYFTIIKRTFSPSTTLSTMTLYDSLVQEGLEKGFKQGIERGIERGLQEGRQEGRQEGQLTGALAAKRETLELILVKRFGKLDEATHARIAGAELADCDLWINRALDATAMDEVFRQ